VHELLFPSAPAIPDAEIFIDLALRRTRRANFSDLEMTRADRTASMPS